MEDDKGLDLSLGLLVGGSSSKSNEKSNTSLDASSNDTNRTSKILSDFRNFLNGGILQQPQGGYFSTFPSSTTNGRVSEDQNAGRFQTSASSTEDVANVEDEKRPIVGDKRKCSYEDTNHHKKQETGSQNSDFENAEASHISITTDDGSTAENEDVAESGAESSGLVPNAEESSKQHANSQASSEASKELPGKITSGLPPFSLQSTRSLNLPSSITFKEAALVTPSMSNDPTQAMNTGSAPMMFGHSHGQLPSLDKDSPWAIFTRAPFHHPYSGRPLSTSATNHGLSDGERPGVKEGSSSQAEDNINTNVSVVFRGPPVTETHKDSSSPSEYPSIRPGMAADLKFGGSGSLPNLPWVSTTWPGPNGRTISGVTYRFSANQIKIVCACHGLHMSPDEFIQHASDVPLPVSDNKAASTGPALASFPGTSSTAAALAKS